MPEGFVFVGLVEEKVARLVLDRVGKPLPRVKERLAWPEGEVVPLTPLTGQDRPLNVLAQLIALDVEPNCL